VSRAAHPARSLDFLSRLHDGELTPSERAHFESHRSHCDECRRAAAEFEATLDYYRTAGTTAPRPDLAARILRRLETSSPRRRPFGVFFGIDLKWAGVFTAALIVTLLGYSLVDRERERKQIRVTFPAAPASPKLAEAPPSAPTAPASREPASRADRKLQEARKESLLAKDEAAPAPAATAAPKANGSPLLRSAAVSADLQMEAKSSPTPPSSNVAQAPVAAQRAARPAAKATSAGGADGASADKSHRARAEADLETASSAGAAASAAPAIRLVVAELDGRGAAPRALNASEIDLKPEDRGRYLVVIGANGIPIEIRREEPARERDAVVSAEPSVLEVLRKLRFPAGDRPRRLLVTVE
jgi:hypothetical protein